MKVIKCPHCKKVFFETSSEVCPFCKKDLKEDLNILMDMFRDCNPFSNFFNEDTK
jgi:acetyl-CoA carboxylase beta subunit